MIGLAQICTYFGGFLILCGIYGYAAFGAPTALIASGFGVVFFLAKYGLQYTAVPWVLVVLNAALLYVFTKRVILFWGDAEKVHQLGYFGVSDAVALASLAFILINLFKK
jgi:hypothetical protein